MTLLLSYKEATAVQSWISEGYQRYKMVKPFSREILKLIIQWDKCSGRAIGWEKREQRVKRLTQLGGRDQ